MEQNTANNQTEASAPVIQRPVQTSLFAFGGIVEESISKVFGATDIKDKATDKKVGFKVALRKKGQIAEALELKGKDNADELRAAMLKQADALMRFAKGEIAALDDNYTFHNFSERKLKSSGLKEVKFTIREVKRTKDVTDEQIAAAYGISLDEAKELRKNFAKKPTPVTDITSEKVEPKALPETTTEQADEEKAIEEGKQVMAEQHAEAEANQGNLELAEKE